MGGGQSLSQAEIETWSDAFFHFLPETYINVGIDDSILRYSGTGSTAVLNDYYSNVQNKLLNQVPMFLEKVSSALAGSSPVSHAVGVGALVISMIIQVALISTKGSESNEECLADMLRRIFADEKASEVRDLMEEYLKRYEIHLRDDSRLVEDTKQKEIILSHQLTRLRNSMLRDGHMNSRALKHWANGAAFHAQMLIHLARLQKKTPEKFQKAKTAATRAINIYRQKTSELLKKYKEYKISKFTLYTSYWNCNILGLVACNSCYFYEADINIENYLRSEICDITPENYVDYFFSKHPHIITLKNYFLYLQKNIDVLCDDDGTFRIK